jgi:hypothetical protein
MPQYVVNCILYYIILRWHLVDDATQYSALLCIIIWDCEIWLTTYCGTISQVGSCAYALTISELFDIPRSRERIPSWERIPIRVCFHKLWRFQINKSFRGPLTCKMRCAIASPRTEGGTRILAAPPILTSQFQITSHLIYSTSSEGEHESTPA